MLVIVVTALYPWGRMGGDSHVSDLSNNFVGLLNDFADLPVTFVFLVESQEENIIKSYDKIVPPESNVKANVKIGKGLGLMIDGVKKYNPWLNYCLLMHLCQALGLCSNILSQAASRPLCADEVRELCNTLIGDVPDPAVDMDTFMGAIKASMSNNEHTKWNPATGEDAPLIDIVKLRRHFTKIPAGLVGSLVAIVVCIVAIIVGISFGGF